MKKSRYFNYFKKYGFVVGITYLLYDRGKQILPKSLYLKMIECRDSAIEKYLLSHIDIPNFTPNIVKSKSCGIKNPIWTLWLQGEESMPDVVRLCYKSICKNKGNGSIILLTENNIKNYVDLPDYIWKLYNEKVITATHFSDIIRMYLLGHYGGLWLDSTILLLKPLPDEIFTSPTYCIHHSRDDQFVFKGRWSGFFWASNDCSIPRHIYNCFLAYHRKERGLIDYFLIDYFIDIAYKRFPYVRNQIDSIPINNVNSTKLKTLLNNLIDFEYFNKITSDTWAFKMSWKNISITNRIDGQRTYYDIIEEHLL